MTTIYEEIVDIFKPASDEDVKKRSELKLQRWLIEFKNRKDVSKNSNGTYNVYGNVDFYDMILFELPIKFNIVIGYFDCSWNKLTSLEGCPKKVGKGFACSYNKLTSLRGCPKEVDTDFYCENNSKKFTQDEVRNVCNVKGVIYV